MAIDLVTLDEFKAYKSVTNDKNDAALSIIIRGASATAKSYCRRTFVDFYSTDKVEYYNGYAYSEFLLKEFPIRSVTSVENTTDGGTTYTALTVGTDYYVNYELDSIVTPDGLSFLGERANPAFNSIKITYKGGYSKAPEDLKLAVLDLVEYYRAEKSTPRKAFEGATLENSAFRSGSGAKFPPHIARVFDIYKSF